MSNLKKFILSIIFFSILNYIPVAAQEHQEESASVQSMDEIIENIVDRISNAIPNFSGYVIHKNNDEVYIDLGRKQGAMLDMEFEIIRESRDIKHPVSGEFAGKIEEKIGELKIKTMRYTLSITEVTNLLPGKQIEPGDKVYSKKRWDKIAILPIFNSKKEQEYFTQIFYDLIINKVTQTTSLQLIPKKKVNQVLMELNLSNSNNFFPEKILKILGEKLKTEVIIMGNLLDLGDAFFINLRFANVETGNIFFVINTELYKTKSLRAMVYSITTSEPITEAKFKNINAAIKNNLNTYNPVKASTKEEKEILSLIFERLIYLDSTGTFAPALAESWNVSKDGKLWIFNLRKNVLFHNGDVFTARDVKNSWQYAILNSSQYGARYLLKAIKGVSEYNGKNDLEGLEILDDNTLQISLIDWDPDFLNKLIHINTSIFSNKSLVSAPEGLVFKNSIGTGSLKFSNQTDNEIILSAFSDYYGSQASINQIKYSVIKDNTLEYQRFLSKELDYYHIEERKESEIAENNIIKSDFSNIYYIAINCHVPPFNNEKIRQALNYSIDYEYFIKNIPAITVSKSILPITQNTEEYSKISFPYTFNQEQARNILKENGAMDYFNQQFILIYPDSDKIFKTIALKIQENLMDIGIKIKIESANQETFISSMESSSPPAFILNSFSNVFFPDSNFYYFKQLFFSQNKGYFGNYSFYNNSAVDNLISSVYENKENDKKKEIYIELENTILREAPFIFLFSKKQEIACQSNITGIAISPDGIDLRKVQKNLEEKANAE